VGWAHATDTPYQWTKQVASHWGGTRNGTVVHWPNGFTARGEVRHQFHHVIDVAPTVLEAAGLPAPSFVNGIQQAPLEGVSMVYSFDDAVAADRHTTQYFEMFVNRGIYHQGWTAVTRHSTPWDPTSPLPALDDDIWELYGPDDWTKPGTWPPSSRTSWPISNGSSSSRPPSTTCCRSTTAGSSGSTPTSPAARSSSTGTPRSCSAGWAG
jgi:arylsulfatase A-like enzyme